MFLLGAIIPVLAFVFESYPRFLNRKFGVDIWTHLLYLKEYHKQKGIPKNIKNGFLVSGDYDYPPAFIFILSKLSFKWVEKYEFLFSPFFDAWHLLIIFYLVNIASGSIVVALLTQLLYVFTPIIILENSSATPRSLGYTLFSITFFSLFIFQQKVDYLYLLVAVVFGSFIFLSHRFTAQGFLFFSIFFSLFYKSFIFLEVFLLSFVLSYVLSSGFYAKVLKGHLGNLWFWYKNIDFRFAHQVKGNYKEFKTGDFVFRLYNQFLKFPPFVLAITNPWTLSVFYILFFAFPQNLIMKNFIWWVVFSYFLSVATLWVPILRFLGEGQRYLELSAFPSAFLSAWLLNRLITSSFSIFVVAGYMLIAVLSFITIVVIQRKAIINDRLRTITPSLQKMFEYLKSLKKKPHLLCIPHQITTNVIYHTKCPVFVNASYATINKISDVYPYLKIPASEVMKKYNLDAILLNEEYAKIEDLKLKKYNLVKRIDNFVLLDLA